MTTTDTPTVNIAVVDDHSLFRKGLINLIHQVDKNFSVTLEAENGKDFFDKLRQTDNPHIAVMDVSMPVMDGFKTTALLKEKHPDVGVLALTMIDDDVTLIKLLKAGVNGYLNKDVEPQELRTAINTIVDTGFYYTERVAGKLVNVIRHPAAHSQTDVPLSEQEMKFIELACSEDTYKVIADKMCLSEKTIDGYRGKLFDKLQVKSRVGLVLYAIRNKLVSLSEIK